MLTAQTKSEYAVYFLQYMSYVFPRYTNSYMPWVSQEHGEKEAFDKQPGKNLKSGLIPERENLSTIIYSLSVKCQLGKSLTEISLLFGGESICYLHCIQLKQYTGH